MFCNHGERTIITENVQLIIDIGHLIVEGVQVIIGKENVQLSQRMCVSQKLSDLHVHFFQKRV